MESVLGSSGSLCEKTAFPESWGLLFLTTDCETISRMRPRTLLSPSREEFIINAVVATKITM